jgi:hypothetical protein
MATIQHGLRQLPLRTGECPQLLQYTSTQNARLCREKESLPTPESRVGCRRTPTVIRVYVWAGQAD